MDDKKAQAALELAVFGAILIFLLGTIVRSAVGNSYTQNQNFKAMRMAMLASWQGSRAAKGKGAVANLSRNSASILFIEDRLSPDFTKYGDLDRNPFIANGAGSFSYEMLYPVDAGEAAANIPIMDVYINGLHFPFTTASYVKKTIAQPGTNGAPSCKQGGPYENYPITPAQCIQNQCLRNQREWVQNGSSKYKLFYTAAVNGTSQFITGDPGGACMAKDTALCSSLPLPGQSGVSNANGDMQYDLLRNGDYTAVETKFGTATDPTPLRSNIAWQWSASPGIVSGNTTDGADPVIGLDPDNNQYPTYDIDGRLKEVTIYGIQGPPDAPTVTYEDFQGGDIDTTWDSNSCGPKPGLQNDSQIYTFTKDGTYLQIKEGKLYNPETGQVVRSANKRDSIDLIQRSIQLSNNTWRFCDQTNPGQPLVCVANDCKANPDPNPVEVCIPAQAAVARIIGPEDRQGRPTGRQSATPIRKPASQNDNCFSSEENIKSTCFDENDNMLFVRSRLKDRRGRFWMTNASGELQVQ